MYFSLVISILILIVSTESKQIATRNLHPDVGLNIVSTYIILLNQAEYYGIKYLRFSWLKNTVTHLNRTMSKLATVTF